MLINGEMVEVGDRVKFRCLVAMRPHVTCCIVRGIRADNSALYVNSNGCKNFVVFPDEITRLIKKGATP